MQWHKCRKKPVVVEFAMPAKKQTIHTLEGYKEYNPETDYLIRGVVGEIYPIKRDIFEQTYERLSGQPEGGGIVE